MYLKDNFQKDNQKFFPLLFGVTEEQDLTKIKRNRPFRVTTSPFHQSEIYCLRIYKNGISFFKK
ncbi:hypothetical protein [Chryseobacterium sp. CT-SW4]|uniref:hypothetical protein n=1 Tax=Chryseobacterium sp. SW-1 TaxID=3157343 RepID=UPI003B01DA44